MTPATMDGVDVLLGRTHLCGTMNVIYKSRHNQGPMRDILLCFYFCLLFLLYFCLCFYALQPDYLLAKIALVSGNSVCCDGTVNTYVSKFW